MKKRSFSPMLAVVVILMVIATAGMYYGLFCLVEEGLQVLTHTAR